MRGRCEQMKYVVLYERSARVCVKQTNYPKHPNNRPNDSRFNRAEHRDQTLQDGDELFH